MKNYILNYLKDYLVLLFYNIIFSHVQAKGINDAIQLPDFKSGKLSGSSEQA